MDSLLMNEGFQLILEIFRRHDGTEIVLPPWTREMRVGDIVSVGADEAHHTVVGASSHFATLVIHGQRCTIPKSACGFIKPRVRASETRGRTLPVHFRSAIAESPAIHSLLLGGGEEQLITWQELCLLNVPILRTIPAAARFACSAALAGSLRGTGASDFLRFSSFAKLVLLRGGAANETAKEAIMRRCVLFVAGKFRTLYEDAATYQRAAGSRESAGFPVHEEETSAGHQQFSTDCTEPSEAVCGRASALLRDGEVSRANAALWDAKVAPQTEETAEAIRALYPRSRGPLVMPCTSLPTCGARINVRDLQRTLHSFPAGSAAGPSRLSPRHLAQLLEAPGSLLGAAVLLLITAIADGKVPPEAVECVFASRGVALAKVGGGIRPLAAGDVLRRIAAKLLCRKVASACRTFFSTRNQVGVGIRAGAEAMIHQSRWHLGKMAEGDVVLKIDVRNAFNSMSRSSFFAALHLNFPSLLGYAWQAYSRPSSVHFGGIVVESQEGFNQGDPLAPLFFSLGLSVITEECRRMVAPLTYESWFLDDGIVVGKAASVAEWFLAFVRLAARIGLVVNTSKCELGVCGTDSYEVDLQGIKRVPLQDVTILGSCIGINVQAHSSKVAAKCSQHVGLLSAFARRCAHGAFVLLRLCSGFSAVAFYLRAQGGLANPSVWEPVDDAVLGFLAQFLPMSNEDVILSRLPISSGGLGLRSPCEMSVISYCASLRLCFDSGLLAAPTLAAGLACTDVYPSTHVHAQSFLRTLREPTADVGPKIQKKVSAFVEEAMRSQLFSNSDVFARARIQSASGPHASAWLLPPPSCLGLCMLSNAEFDILLRHRFGASVHSPGGTCLRCSTAICTNDGYHSLTCMAGGDRAILHNKVRDLLLHFATVGMLNPEKELHAFPVLSPDSRLDVGFMYKGKMWLVDVAITHALRPDQADFAAQSPGGAANQYGLTKFRTYGALLDEHTQLLLPFIADTFGAWSDHALQTIKIIGRAFSARTNSGQAGQWEVATRLNHAVMRGVAHLLFNVAAAAP